MDGERSRCSRWTRAEPLQQVDEGGAAAAGGASVTQTVLAGRRLLQTRKMPC